MNEPFDPGLQPERTALAWRRTSLALLTASLVATRVLPEQFGPWSALAGLAGVICASAFLATIHRRYRQHHQQLTQHGERYPLACGSLIAAMAAMATAAAIVSSIAVIMAVLRVV